MCLRCSIGIYIYTMLATILRCWYCVLCWQWKLCIEAILGSRDATSLLLYRDDLPNWLYNFYIESSSLRDCDFVNLMQLLYTAKWKSCMTANKSRK